MKAVFEVSRSTTPGFYLLFSDTTLARNAAAAASVGQGEQAHQEQPAPKREVAAVADHTKVRIALFSYYFRSVSKDALRQVCGSIHPCLLRNMRRVIHQTLRINHPSAHTVRRQRQELINQSAASSALREAKEGFDHHFFTDDAEVQASVNVWGGWATHWHGSDDALNARVRAVRRVPTSNATRLTSGWLRTKWIKFGPIPHALRGYSHLLHVDASGFVAYARFVRYPVPAASRVERLIRDHPSSALFATRHPRHVTVDQEWRVTTWEGLPGGPLESLASLQRYESDMAATRIIGVANATALAMGLFLRQISPIASGAVRAVSRAFEETFDHLVEYGLRRDQNVFPVSLLHEQLQFAAGSMLCGPADGVLLYARRLPR